MFEEKKIHRKWFWRASPLVPCLHMLLHGIASSQGGAIAFGQKYGFSMALPIWGIWVLFPITTVLLWLFYKSVASQTVAERLRRVTHIDASLTALAKQQSWTKIEARIDVLSRELRPYDLKLIYAWLEYQKSYYTTQRILK